MGEGENERDGPQFYDLKNLAMAVAVEARAGAEGEAADVMILLLKFASVCGIDIARAVERAMARNAARYLVEIAWGRAAK